MAETTSFIGTGRRKNSIARVRLVNGNGKITVNSKDLEEYFGVETLKVIVKQPLVATNTLDKFDVICTVKGGGISGQAGAIRHGIARALLKNPKILIMDEATSNLDYITEKTIENTINKFSKNMTTIIIAHRLSTIKDCDKIFVFKDGQIVETGNHSDLLKQRGYYYQLWNGQDKNNI